MSRAKVVSLTRAQKQRLTSLLRRKVDYLAFERKNMLYVQFLDTAGPLECKRQMIWQEKAELWLPVEIPTFEELKS
jgi:hypothetical protein